MSIIYKTPIQKLEEEYEYWKSYKRDLYNLYKAGLIVHSEFDRITKEAMEVQNSYKNAIILLYKNLKK